MGYERKATRFPVAFGRAFAGEHLAGQGTITNLSLGGCSIESTIRLTVRSAVGLHVHLPDSPFPIQIERAIVRWACGNLFGLEFEQISEPDMNRLRELILDLEQNPSASLRQPEQYDSPPKHPINHNH